MAGNLKPLNLVIRGVNRVAAPIRQVNDQIESMLKPVRRVGSAFGALGREMRLPGVARGIGSVGNALAGLARSAAFGSVGIFAFSRAMEDLAERGDTIADVAGKADLTVEKLQEWRYAAERLDVSNEGLDQGLLTFNKNAIDAARGAGRMRFAFEALGVAAVRGGEVRETGELLDEVGQKLANVADVKTRTRLATALFGDSDFGLMFAQGNAEVQRLMLEARARGAIKSKAQIGQMQALKAVLIDVRTGVRVLADSVLSELLPELTKTAKAWGDWLGDEDNRKALVKDIVPAIKNVGQVLKILAGVLLSVTSSLGGTIALFGVAAGVVLGPLLLALGQLTAALFNVGAWLIPLTVRWLAFLVTRLLYLAATALPPVIAALQAMFALLIANPVGLTIVAIVALGAAFLLLYKKCKPFQEFIDGAFQRFLDGAATVGKFLGLVDDPESRMGSEEQQRARAVARIRAMRASGAHPGAAHAGAPLLSARNAYGSGQRWQGNLAVQVAAEPGSRATVKDSGSRGPGPTLETGRLMDPRW